MPLVEVLADMEYEGIKVDKEKLNELGLQFKEIIIVWLNDECILPSIGFIIDNNPST